MAFVMTPAIEYLEDRRGEYLADMRWRGERSHVGEIYSIKEDGCPFEDVDSTDPVGWRPCQCYPYVGMPLSEEWSEDDEKYWLANGRAGHTFMIDKQIALYKKHEELSNAREGRNEVIR